MIPKTKKPPLSIIVCVDQLGGYAKNGKIPWDVVEDRKRFVNITNNGVCIMGRHTYEDMCEMIKNRGTDLNSIEHILPNRTSFVLSSNPKYKAIGATVVPSVRAAWQSLDEMDTREIFILGGERLYVEALSDAAKIYMTILKQPYDCDNTFPLTIINKHYIISSGEETNELYQVEYHRKLYKQYQQHRAF